MILLTSTRIGRLNQNVFMPGQDHKNLQVQKIEQIQL